LHDLAGWDRLDEGFAGVVLHRPTISALAMLVD
jgi:hypothetical protein